MMTDQEIADRSDQASYWSRRSSLLVEIGPNSAYCKLRSPPPSARRVIRPKSAIQNHQSKIINQKLQMLWVSAFTPTGCNVNSNTANNGQPPTPAGSNVDSKISKL
jgi:hypothetical protein